MTVSSRLVINAKDLGAVGNGVADDTAALQATINTAIASNSAVFIPQGNYKLSASLIANAPNFAMFGEAGNMAILSLTINNSDALIIGPGGSGSSKPSGYIRDIQFQGPTPFVTTTSAGIKLNGMADFILENINLVNFDIGIDFANRSPGCQFINCKTSGVNVGVNFRAVAGNDINFNNCWFNGRIAAVSISPGAADVKFSDGQYTVSQASSNDNSGVFILGKDYLTNAIGNVGNVEIMNLDINSFQNCWAIRSYGQTQISVYDTSFLGSSAIGLIKSTGSANSSIVFINNSLAGSFTASSLASISSSNTSLVEIGWGSGVSTISGSPKTANWLTTLNNQSLLGIGSGFYKANSKTTLALETIGVSQSNNVLQTTRDNILYYDAGSAISFFSQSLSSSGPVAFDLTKGSYQQVVLNANAISSSVVIPIGSAIPPGFQLTIDWQQGSGAPFTYQWFPNIVWANVTAPTSQQTTINQHDVYTFIYDGTNWIQTATSIKASSLGAQNLVWKGTWSNVTAYNVNDAVAWNGNTWFALTTSTNQPPDTSPAAWRVLSIGGSAGPVGPAGVNFIGPWSSATNYNVRDAVSFNGSSYYAVSTNQNSQPPSAAWQLLAAAGTAGPAGSPGMVWKGPWSNVLSYAVGDGVSSGGSSYIAISSNLNQQPPNATYWQSLALQGSTGTNGTNGNTIWSGTGAPAVGLGVANDFYIDKSAFVIYGPKTASWPSGVSLVGPTGSTGLTGASGSAVRSGNGPPSSVNPAVQNLNDFYIDLTSTSYNIYGPKQSSGANSGWGNPTALIGPQGPAGSGGGGGGGGTTNTITVNYTSITGNVAIDLSLGSIVVITLAANMGANAINLTNAADGQLVWLEWIQGGPSVHTYNWPTNVYFVKSFTPQTVVSSATNNIAVGRDGILLRASGVYTPSNNVQVFYEMSRLGYN